MCVCVCVCVLHEGLGNMIYTVIIAWNNIDHLLRLYYTKVMSDFFYKTFTNVVLISASFIRNLGVFCEPTDSHLYGIVAISIWKEDIWSCRSLPTFTKCVWEHLLWLRGRASILLSEGGWFDSPGLHVEDTEPQTAADVLVSTLHGCRHHQCMNYRKSLWTKASDKYPKM